MIGQRSVLALVIARGGSKGVPGKNIARLGGKPLIAWSIEAARASRYVDRVVLSTEDPEIAEVACQYGCDVPFRRDPSLATDTASSMDVVMDALSRVQRPGVVVLLQPTSPLRTASDIDAGLELLERSHADACVAVAEAQDHPFLVFRASATGELSPYVEGDLPTRRQEFPSAWVLNGAFYAAPIETLERDRSFTAGRVVGLPMSREASIDIDELDDFETAERALMARSVRQ